MYGSILGSKNVICFLERQFHMYLVKGSAIFIMKTGDVCVMCLDGETMCESV